MSPCSKLLPRHSFKFASSQHLLFILPIPWQLGLYAGSSECIHCQISADERKADVPVWTGPSTLTHQKVADISGKRREDWLRVTNFCYSGNGMWEVKSGQRKYLSIAWCEVHLSWVFLPHKQGLQGLWIGKKFLENPRLTLKGSSLLFYLELLLPKHYEWRASARCFAMVI